MIAVGVHSQHPSRTSSKSGPVTRRFDVLATRYDFILAPMLTLDFMLEDSVLDWGLSHDDRQLKSKVVAMSLPPKCSNEVRE